MADERVIEDVERRTSDLIEVEEKLRERATHDDPEPDSTTRISLPSLDGTAARRRVTGASTTGNRVGLEVEGGIEFTLPLPDDPEDASEPLVALCQWHDVDPEHFADLDEIAVFESPDDESLLAVPPEKRRHRVVLDLPGMRSRAWTRTPLVDRLSRAQFRVAHWLAANTPIVGGSTASHPFEPSINGYVIMIAAGLIATFAATVAGGFDTGFSAFVASFGSAVLLTIATATTGEYVKED